MEDWEHALLDASHKNDLEKVKEILQEDSVERVNLYRGLPLTTAAKQGHLEMVQLLLSCKAFTVLNGKSHALFWAAYFGHKDVAKCLLDHGSIYDASWKSVEQEMHDFCASYTIQD